MIILIMSIWFCASDPNDSLEVIETDMLAAWNGGAFIDRHDPNTACVLSEFTRRIYRVQPGPVLVSLAIVDDQIGQVNVITRRRNSENAVSPAATLYIMSVNWLSRGILQYIELPEKNDPNGAPIAFCGNADLRTGDMNGDGFVNNADLAMLSVYAQTIENHLTVFEDGGEAR
jgi:hypothetical protein